MFDPAKNYRDAYYKAISDFVCRSDDELVILLYHGVTRTLSHGIENHAKKHIPEADFIDHMRHLKENCTVLSMDDVLALTESNEAYPRRSVAITFDDGFENNYSIAAPVLDDFALPATFYVSSGATNTDLMFWVDILEDSINRTAEPSISVSALGRVFPMESMEDRLYALDQIKSYCKTIAPLDKDKVVSEVVSESKIAPEIASSPNYQKMTWNQVKELDSHDNFIVGGHSLYHDILGKEPKCRADIDIQASIDLLTYQTGRAQTHYSYPEGQPEHYTAGNIATLQKAGIRCCPSAVFGLNLAGADLFHLRRIAIGFYGLPLPYMDSNLT